MTAFYSFYLTPALCVSRERRPFAGPEFRRGGITKPRDNLWKR